MKDINNKVGYLNDILEIRKILNLNIIIMISVK